MSDEVDAANAIVPMGEPSARAPRGVSRPREVAGWVLAVIVVIAVVFGVGAVVLMNVMPDKMLIPAILLDAALGIFVAILLLTSKDVGRRTRFIVASVLAVLLVAGNLALLKVGTDFRGVITDVQAPAVDTVQYDIVVPVTGSDDPAALKGLTMAEVTGDPNQLTVHDNIAQLVGEVTFVPQPDWPTAVDALVTGTVPSMCIQDGYMQIYADADADKYSTLKIIASFQVPGTDSAWQGQPAPALPVGADKPFIVYISGVDTSGSIAKRSRSDVNQLMVVNPTTGKVLLVNTPRDYYVQLAGTTGLRDKLTHAGVYGINVSIGTMDYLYGINIDYYVRLNFTSLVTIVDDIGGIDVDSPEAFTTTYGNYQIVKGINHLNGAQALAFARERHAFSTGDRQRGVDQQLVITAIIKKVTQPSVLVNYPSFLSDIQSAIQTSMPADAISAQIKQQLQRGRSWKIDTYSVNGSDSSQYTYSYPHQKLYVMVPDQSTVETAKKKIAAVMAGK